MKDGQKYKAAVSQCTGNRKTTALLIISKRVQKFTSFTTLASVYAKGKMFSAYLEGKLVTNGKLEHAVLVVLILEGLGQTKVVATLNNEVAELIAQAVGIDSSKVFSSMPSVCTELLPDLALALLLMQKAGCKPSLTAKPGAT